MLHMDVRIAFQPIHCFTVSFQTQIAAVLSIFDISFGIPKHYASVHMWYSQLSKDEEELLPDAIKNNLQLCGVTT